MPAELGPLWLDSLISESVVVAVLHLTRRQAAIWLTSSILLGETQLTSAARLGTIA